MSATLIVHIYDPLCNMVQGGGVWRRAPGPPADVPFVLSLAMEGPCRAVHSYTDIHVVVVGCRRILRNR